MRETILEALRTALLTRAPLAAIPESVWKRTGALNTWGTNAIEGNTLTWRDVERLLLQGRNVPHRPVADILETLKHQETFQKLPTLASRSVNLVLVQELHEAVFGGIKGDAGRFRMVNVRIVGSPHIPPRVERVLPEMDAWEREYERRERRGDPVFPTAAWMHHQFESVHPFADGNGRVGRLLLNLHFLRHSWPPVHILPPDRERYLSAMEAEHRGNLGPFEALLCAAMARSLLDLLDQVGTALDELQPLKALAKRGGHTAKYLALRSAQEELPALKVSGDWRSSARALLLYRKVVGRGG